MKYPRDTCLVVKLLKARVFKRIYTYHLVKHATTQVICFCQPAYAGVTVSANISKT